MYCRHGFTYLAIQTYANVRTMQFKFLGIKVNKAMPTCTTYSIQTLSLCTVAADDIHLRTITHMCECLTYGIYKNFANPCITYKINRGVLYSTVRHNYICYKAMPKLYDIDILILVHIGTI